ncbi:cupin domain-containing protein [Sphingomonas montanisoli]|uniref:Cupin domain-containing protein n=1 Tax=Sphingomonas montanisoli TaxID=2606412 RepID=A0A5D9C011_9SPHN|nr:cupin domain-containing protein [Sphingomonas montanisoli]TZG25074.1 cupin domain-containing protein [Sphingomonas montanisoli]
MGVRRVVSGQDASGKSIIVSDEVIEPVGLTVPIWREDDTAGFPRDGSMPPVSRFFPGPGGSRFIIMTFPAKGQAIVPSKPGEIEAKVGTGIGDVMEPGGDGFHTTDTIDYEVVLSGEISIELDDGIVKHLKAGDCFIQNGTRHRWFNLGDVPAVVAVVLVGGHPRS